MKTLTTVLPVILLSAIVFFGSNGCTKTETDTVYPVIDMSSVNAFPHDCDTLRIGESFVFHGLFTDNAELGSYSLDIHNNFDHHSHSSSIVECPLDPLKTPVNPLVFIEEYLIPAGTTLFEAVDTIKIPFGADPGDYHMMIRLTDREGWQTVKGISVKILE